MKREMTFAQAAETHLDDVYGYLTWFTGDRGAADDLTGETFERALRLWHRFDPRRGSARTWLCQVARTVALDHFRSEKRRVRREELASSPERVDEQFAEGLSADLDHHLADEALTLDLASRSDDFKEHLRARRDRRDPNFTGR